MAVGKQGAGFGHSGAVLGGANVSYSAEATAYFARSGGTFTDSQKRKYDYVFRTLKTAGTLAKLDALWLLGIAPDQSTADANLISSSYHLTYAADFPFEVGIGYKGPNDISKYIDTAFNPTTAISPKFIQGSASVGMTVVAANKANSQYLLGGTLTGSSYIEPYYSGDGKLYWKGNDPGDQTVNPAPPSPLAGLWVSNRVDSNHAFLMWDNTQEAASSGVAPTPGNEVFKLLGAGDPSTAIASMAFIGGGLSLGDLAALQLVSDYTFSNALSLVCLGDSMAAGAGVSDPTQHWINVAAVSLGRRSVNQGIGSATYPQVASSALSSGLYRDYLTIYFAGHNATDPVADLAALQSMVASQTGKGRFVILLPTMQSGTAPNTQIVNERAAIIAAYPSNYIDTQAVLAAHGDGGTQDNSDIANGYVPTSLRSDTIHLNATGQSYVAAAVVSFIQGKGW